MNSSFANVTAKQLRRAAQIKDKIEALQNELAGILGEENGAAAPAARTARKSRRNWSMSAAARERIAAAQRERWARHRAEKKKK